MGMGTTILLSEEHPRARGENVSCASRSLVSLGTSPRTRGKPLGPLEAGYLDRNIPAHAGKTLVCGADHTRLGEHPRARGENRQSRQTRLPDWGTSPRTRGKPAVAANPLAGLGNIPAHAGKTAVARAALSAVKEHPRARGENAVGSDHDSVGLGTSPRTRGKPNEISVRSTGKRNIPAHAGKTKPPCGKPKIYTEHPRARGENPWPNHGQTTTQGTSPRTRGKPDHQRAGEADIRNIPAHAGKTHTRRVHNQASTEHPRARGENGI